MLARCAAKAELGTKRDDKHGRSASHSTCRIVRALSGDERAIDTGGPPPLAVLLVLGRRRATRRKRN